MKRKVKKILGLLRRLDELLEEESNLFFRERPFLKDRNSEEIKEYKREREFIDANLKEVINEIHSNSASSS